jgi:hypothetical protein
MATRTVDKSIDLRQPQSGTLSLCREEWLEYPIDHISGHADASIANSELKYWPADTPTLCSA